MHVAKRYIGEHRDNPHFRAGPPPAAATGPRQCTPSRSPDAALAMAVGAGRLLPPLPRGGLRVALHLLALPAPAAADSRAAAATSRAPLFAGALLCATRARQEAACQKQPAPGGGKVSRWCVSEPVGGGATNVVRARAMACTPHPTHPPPHSRPPPNLLPAKGRKDGSQKAAPPHRPPAASRAR